MIRRAHAHIAVLACAGVLTLLLPAAGQAASGGTGIGPSGGSSPSGGSGAQSDNGAASQPGDVPISASGDGVTIATQTTALLRNGLSFSGSVSPSDAGDVVEIERSGPRTNGVWEPTTQATVASGGSFSAVWQTDHIGRFAIRAILQRPGATATAAASSGWPTVTVTVYRPSIATLYGPGFWGHRTACGVVLRRSTIGVANRTLSCGTPVAIYYRGRTMIVPVIDRGPYANGADWDLTMATGSALALDTTATIGAVSLPAGS